MSAHRNKLFDPSGYQVVGNPRRRGAKGVWYVPLKRISTGSRTQKRVAPGSASEAEARAAVENLMRGRREARPISFGEALDAYFDSDEVKILWRMTTRRNTLSASKVWRDYFSGFDLGGIDTFVINKFLAERLKAGRSRYTVRHDRARLKAFFAWAEKRAQRRDDPWIIPPRNPVELSQGISTEAVPGVELTDQQVLDLFTALDAGDSYDEEGNFVPGQRRYVKMLVLLGAITGRRLFELVSLRWMDIRRDGDECTIFFSEKFTKEKKPVLRNIDRLFYEALQAYRKRVATEDGRIVPDGERVLSDMAFNPETEEVRTPSGWGRALKDAGLEHLKLKFHHLRSHSINSLISICPNESTACAVVGVSRETLRKHYLRRRDEDVRSVGAMHSESIMRSLSPNSEETTDRMVEGG